MLQPPLDPPGYSASRLNYGLQNLAENWSKAGWKVQVTDDAFS